MTAGSRLVQRAEAAKCHARLGTYGRGEGGPRNTRKNALINLLTSSQGQVKYCRCTLLDMPADRAGVRPNRVQCRVEAM